MGNGVKLTELEARFVKILDDVGTRLFVDTLAESDGVMFLCPKCYVANGGKDGTHSVTCLWPSVSPKEVPGPGRWSPSGSGISDLTLGPGSGSASVRLETGCKWHGFVRRGEATVIP